MLILYHCYGGTHSSILACFMHLNKIPIDHVPDKEAIANLPLFDQLTSQEHGRIINVGTDEFGNTICSLGVKNQKNMVIPALKDLYYELYKSTDTFLDVDTSKATNLTMKVGSFISRSLKIPAIGKPIVVAGSQKAYMDIAQIVKNVKKQAKEAAKKATVT